MISNYFEVKVKHILAFATLSSLCVTPTFAGLPNIYYDIPKEIKAPHGVQIIAATKDGSPKEVSSDAVYYLPSNQDLEISNANWNWTVKDKVTGKRGNYCEIIDLYSEMVKEVLQRRKELVRKSEEDKAAFDDAKARKRDAENRIVRYCSEKEAQNENAETLKRLLDQTKGDLLVAQTTMAAKIQQGVAVDVLVREMNDLAARVGDLTVRFTTASYSGIEVNKDCIEARRALEIAQRNLADLEANGINEALNLSTLTSRLNDELAGYSDKEGGSANGIWDDGYLKAKAEFEKLNPGVTLKKLPQKQLNFYFSEMGTLNEQERASFPMFLGGTASGVHSVLLNKNATPSGLSENDPEHFNLLRASNIFDIDASSTDGTSGAYKVKLSIFGACGILQDLENGLDNPGFSLSSSSVFGTSSNVRVKASYNLYRIFEKIEKSGEKSGGFLNLDRQSYHDIWEDMNEKEHFDFEFFSDDHIPDTEIADLRKNLKEELKSRVLTSFAKMTLDVSLPEVPQERNSFRSIREVSSLFGFFPVHFTMIRSIFGSNSSQATLKSKWNVMTKEEWNYNRIIPKVNTVSVSLKFKPIKK